MQVARVASEIKEWSIAEEALRWASVVEPENPRPREAMVETLLLAGERDKALSAFEELRRVAGETPEVVRLRARLAEAGAARGKAP